MPFTIAVCLLSFFVFFLILLLSSSPPKCLLKLTPADLLDFSTRTQFTAGGSKCREEKGGTPCKAFNFCALPIYRHTPRTHTHTSRTTCFVTFFCLATSRDLWLQTLSLPLQAEQHNIECSCRCLCLCLCLANFSSNSSSYCFSFYISLSSSSSNCIAFSTSSLLIFISIFITNSHCISIYYSLSIFISI